jgi:hypothetical protein
VQQAQVDLAGLAIEQQRVPVSELTVPDRLVDDEVVAVPASSVRLLSTPTMSSVASYMKCWLTTASISAGVMVMAGLPFWGETVVSL